MRVDMFPTRVCIVLLRTHTRPAAVSFHYHWCRQVTLPCPPTETSAFRVAGLLDRTRQCTCQRSRRCLLHLHTGTPRASLHPPHVSWFARAQCTRVGIGTRTWVWAGGHVSDVAAGMHSWARVACVLGSGHCARGYVVVFT